MNYILDLRLLQDTDVMFGAKVELDSYVRVIDFFIESIDLANLVFRHVFVKEEGRTPYHPAVLLKLHFYDYHYGVRSSRKYKKI